MDDLSGVNVIVGLETESIRSKTRIILNTQYSERLLRNFNFSREFIFMRLFNVLIRRHKNPNAPKDEIVGCMCNIKGWQFLSSDDPDGGVFCKKTKATIREKTVVSCQPCDEECPICLTSLTHDVMATSCGHKFHKWCIEQVGKGHFFKFPCPLCRETVSTSSVKDVRADFEMYSRCQCCVRHQTRRPNVFSSSAPWIQTVGCGSDLAIVLRLLLQFSDRSTLAKICECRNLDGTSCRAILRDVMQKLQ